MTLLLKMVGRQTREPTLNREVHKIAKNLLANLFYFEPGYGSLASPKGRSGSITISRDSITLTGTVRSRLRHNSVELKNPLSKVLGFFYVPETYPTHAAELPLNLRWTGIRDF
jgi:hypothetical protein